MTLPSTWKGNMTKFQPIWNRNGIVMDAALAVAKERRSIMAVTRLLVAERAGVSEGTVSNVFPTMEEMRKEIVREGIKRKDAEVVGLGLALGDFNARNAPPELKRAALATF
jgi:AcrR family transcriptional regulator